DYASSIKKMNEVLQKYPDTPLRDMALFWLARSYFKAGNQQEAARYLSQFSKEYPDNSLKNTVEDELLSLTARYEKGEKLPVKQPDRQPALKARSEAERIAASGAEEAKQAAAAKAEQDRLAVIKTEMALRTEAAQKAQRARIAGAGSGEEKQATAVDTSALPPQQKRAEEKTGGGKSAYREKAIGQYKAIIDKFPASTAAVTSAVILRELGIAVAAATAGQRLFEEAVTSYRQNDCHTALELLDRFLAGNPDSLLAADANLYKADCYLKLSAQ
ncbi:MAG: tetratricopeptide repeat protein, partial [Desulfuromonadaceae bacterium]